MIISSLFHYLQTCDLPVNTLTSMERLNWSHAAYGLDTFVWMKFLIQLQCNVFQGETVLCLFLYLPEYFNFNKNTKKYIILMKWNHCDLTRPVP